MRPEGSNIQKLLITALNQTVWKFLVEIFLLSRTLNLRPICGPQISRKSREIKHWNWTERHNLNTNTQWGRQIFSVWETCTGVKISFREGGNLSINFFAFLVLPRYIEASWWYSHKTNIKYKNLLIILFNLILTELWLRPRPNDD